MVEIQNPWQYWRQNNGNFLAIIRDFGVGLILAM